MNPKPNGSPPGPSSLTNRFGRGVEGLRAAGDDCSFPSSCFQKGKLKMIKSALSGAALSLMVGTMLITGASTMAAAEEPTLSEEKFEHSKKLYFQRCAGCHGVLRKGATGKSLEPKDTKKLGQERLEKIIAIGTEGGMNNFDDLFTKEEIADLATYIQIAGTPRRPR